jgi:hypothetical protein
MEAEGDVGTGGGEAGAATMGEPKSLLSFGDDTDLRLSLFGPAGSAGAFSLSPFSLSPLLDLKYDANAASLLRFEIPKGDVDDVEARVGEFAADELELRTPSLLRFLRRPKEERRRRVLKVPVEGEDGRWCWFWPYIDGEGNGAGSRMRMWSCEIVGCC